MHYGHNIRKYNQILKIDLKIFRVIDHYNLSLFNVHNDIMSRNNMHRDSKCILSKQIRSFQILANQGFNLWSFNLKYSTSK